MGRFEKIHGFVLKKKNILGRDVVVTIFTKEQGKLRLIVKGVRNVKSRRAAHIQTGNLIEAEVRSYHDSLYLEQSSLASGFLSLRHGDCVSYIYLFLAVIDGLMPEGQEDAHIFSTIQKFFIALGKNPKNTEALRQSLQKVMEQLGYVDKILSLSELIEIAENHIEKRLPRHVII